MITTVCVQPADGVPIDCTETSDGWRIPGVIGTPVTSTPCILAPTFDVFIDQQPTHIAALLPRLYWHCQDVYNFCEKASDLSQIMLVTDSGAAENMGTFGWIIGTTEGLRLASGSGPVSGLIPALMG
jgi:hypothetical protein